MRRSLARLPCNDLGRLESMKVHKQGKSSLQLGKSWFFYVFTFLTEKNQRNKINGPKLPCRLGPSSTKSAQCMKMYLKI